MSANLTSIKFPALGSLAGLPLLSSLALAPCSSTPALLVSFLYVHCSHLIAACGIPSRTSSSLQTTWHSTNLLVVCPSFIHASPLTTPYPL
ncbi:hypothetical protein B0H19DRAFT_1184623 [Mycena capillaripes]|nr:hypothetical protein B0H19DRAFT_1184623 [Mycena capillaripes]